MFVPAVRFWLSAVHIVIVSQQQERKKKISGVQPIYVKLTAIYRYISWDVMPESASHAVTEISLGYAELIL